MTAETAHLDRFAWERRPDPDAMPELLFDLPELRSPERLNCGVHLLDRQIAAGAAERRCLLSETETWTYGRTYETVNRIAHVLRDDLGIVPGNRVLLRGFNGPMLAACWLAVMKVGAIAVTTMPLYRAAELGAIIAKARVRHALCDARLAADLEAAVRDAEGFRTLYFGPDAGGDGLEAAMRAKATHFDAVPTAAEDIALIAFTSGTTGIPKAALHTHRDVIAICVTFCDRVLRPQAGDLFAGSPPLGFTYGLGGLLVFPLHAGAASLLLEKASSDDLLAAIETHRVTTLFTAPVAYRAMTTACDRYDLSSLRACVSAGETLPKPVWDGWHAKTGLKIIDGIGSTEMLHIFIGSPVEEIRPGATGRVVPGYRAEVHDDAGRPLPPGEIGRLAVKGPTGCKYLDDPRQREYVRGGWNYPGDAYRMDEDGYFWYVARADDMIVSAGYNIAGPEVEQALLAHPSVRECAVVAKPDPERGTNIVKAYVVLAAGASAGAEELVAFCRERIAPFKAPREIEFVTELPRTQTGKVQRFKLRERAAAEG